MHKFVRSDLDKREMNLAIRISLGVSLLLLALKGYAYYLTNSAAILSDVSESVIHIFAVSFAAYSMWLSLKPADKDHLYGHEKIGFFSAGFEGAIIIVAACYIFYKSIYKILSGLVVENIDVGIEFILVVVIINLLLGIYLIKKGRRYKSIVLEANGKHMLTDCWTSVAVVVALVLIKFTGWTICDPIFAMVAALNILWMGSKLIKKSVSGLMDRADKDLHRKIAAIITQETSARNLEFHNLRHRESGSKVFIEFHLLFPKDFLLSTAHEMACEIESTLQVSLDRETDVFTHLEPLDSHDTTHEKFGLSI